MRTILISIPAVIIAIVIFYSSVLYNNPETAINSDSKHEVKKSGVDRSREFMQGLYYPKSPDEVSRERSEYLQQHGSFRDLGEDYSGDNIISWESVGPNGIRMNAQPNHFFSGRVISIAMHSDNPNIIYCGAASGGIWKSTDGGIHWVILLDTLACPSVSSIEVSFLSSANTVWFSTGANTNGHAIRIGRVYKSTNGGNTWSAVNAIPSSAIWVSKIEINDFDNNIVFVGTDMGLYKTTNGGTNFTQTLNLPVSDVLTYTNIFSPDTENVIAAVLSGSNSGIRKSTNGGSNFTNIPLTGFDAANCNRITLARNSGTQITYALIGTYVNRSFQGIWKSTNRGSSWLQTNFPSSAGQSEYNHGIAVGSNNKVYVGYNADKIYTSTNEGTSWNPGNFCHPDIQRIHVYSNELMYHVSDGGIFRSTNQGVDWITAAKIPLSQSYHMTADDVNPNRVWTSLQDNGTIEGYDDFGIWTTIGCCDGIDFVKALGFGFYSVVGHWSRYNKVDLSSGVQTVWSDGLPGTGVGPDLKYSPASNDLFTSVDHLVYKSNETALPWVQVGSRPHPTEDKHVGRMIAIGNNVLVGFRYEPTNPPIRKFNSASGNWETPDLTGIPPNIKISGFDLGNFSSNRVYMTVTGTTGARVFKSSNAGSSWSNITGNLPSLVNTTCILVNKSNENIIYIGSDFGVYYTTNGGTNWFNLSSGLPSVCYITDLDFSANNFFVYASTYGRGVFRANIQTIGIEKLSSEIPKNFFLSQNYPNPFNPVTNIEVNVPRSSVVRLVVYDILGKEVSVLVNNETLNAGIYQIDFNASWLTSGVYFYRIEAGDFKVTRKMILAK